MIALCCCITTFVSAYDGIRYFWSFGDIGVSWENLTGKSRFGSYANVGSLNWITRSGIGWGFNMFNFEGSQNWLQMLILPAEVFYSPLRTKDGNPILTFYGRGGLLTKIDKGSMSFKERSEFFGAAGLRASWFPLMGESWSVYTGAFIEFTTRKELRVGISIDFSIFALIYFRALLD